MYRVARRARWYRRIAYVNAYYPHRFLLYIIAALWSTATVINDVWFDASWDILNLSRTEYVLTNGFIIYACIGSLLAQRIKQNIASLHLSASCDAMASLAIFSYSTEIFFHFGAVLDCGILWELSASLMIYAISDAILLRLISAMPKWVPDIGELAQLLARDRFRPYVGVNKWKALTDAVTAIDIVIAAHNAENAADED